MQSRHRGGPWTIWLRKALTDNNRPPSPQTSVSDRRPAGVVTTNDPPCTVDGAVWVQRHAGSLAPGPTRGGLYEIHSPILGACLRTIAPVAALYPGNWNKSLLRASAASSRPKV